MVAQPKTDSALARLYRLMARVRQAERARAAGLLSNEAFEEQLTLERARTDRSGQPFALIVFSIASVDSDEEQKRAEHALASTLIERTRLSDVKGYYGHQIAAILPYTTKEGAARVLDPIETLFRKKLAAEGFDSLPAPKLTFAIYEYPDDERRRTGSRMLRGRESAGSAAVKARLQHVS